MADRQQLVNDVIEALFHSFGGDVARHNFDPGAEKAVALVAEACAKVAEEMKAGFLSEEYATHQPLSSFGERFACDQVASAIRQQFGGSSNG